MASSYFGSLSDGGYLESCIGDNYVLPDSRHRDVLLYTDTSSQSLLFGYSNGVSTMRVGSNIVYANNTLFASNVLSIGASNALDLNTFHKFVIVGPSNSAKGPHMATFTDDDLVYPIFQQRHNAHNDISMGFDTYWTGSNWNCSDSNGVFRIQKTDGKLIFASSCNANPGDNVTQAFRTALTINSNSFLGVGYSNPTHRVSILAEDKSLLGPHLGIYTDIDTTNPVFQMRNWTHDDITQSFDTYYIASGDWISSDSNANFRFMKNQGQYRFFTSCNNTPGSVIDETSFRLALAINSNSYIGIGSSNVFSRVTLTAEDQNPLGPHLSIFTDTDSANAVYYMRNWTHDDITQAYDMHWDGAGSNWVSGHAAANFALSKKDGRFMIMSSCNNVPGTSVSMRVALAINSNSFVGIGYSNPSHRLSFMAEAQSMLGPHVAYYVSTDTINPVSQIRHWDHDNIIHSYDTYWNSTNWVSSHGSGNFQMAKEKGQLRWKTACNIAAGDTIAPSDFRTALAINSNSFLAVGSSNATYRLTVRAEDRSMLGPHVAFYSDADTRYPLYEMRHWTHDDISHSYDMFYDGTNWISSHASGNYQIAKRGGTLMILSASNQVPGSIINPSDFRVSFAISDNQYIGIGTSTPSQRLTLNANDKSQRGPHVAILTQNDNYPLVHMRNWSHDDIQHSFDTYFNGTNWISSDSNANFRLSKKSGRLMFFTACNLTPGSTINETSFRPAFTVNSNSFISIGTSNAINRITVNAEDQSMLGPHTIIYTSADDFPVYQQRNWTHDDVTLAFDHYYSSSTNSWVSSHSSANYQIAKRDSRFMILSACNQTPGSSITFQPAFTINSNSAIGIGTSNPTQRITVVGPNQDSNGPHMAFYSTQDTVYPMMQIHNWAHDDITQSFDAYYDATQWVSSHSSANFQVRKKDGHLLLTSACNTPAGSTISSFATALAVNSNSFIGIGASNPTHRLTMRAENQSALGPHIAVYTYADSNYPLFQMRNWKHDDIAMSFDAYYDSTTSSWLSSSSNGNFQMYKRGGHLLFMTCCNTLPSSNLTSSWRPALAINSNSFIGINTSNQTHRLTIAGPSNSVLGPHVAYHTEDDNIYPVFQQYNDRHDLISLNFDAYWNGANWISSHSNTNFQILKTEGRLMFRTVPFQNAGGVLDNAWQTGITLNSNSFVGIRTSNPEYPLDIYGSTMFRNTTYFMSNVLPRSNMVYDLGSSNLRWRDLYLSGNSINLQELMLKKDSYGGLYVYSAEFQEPSRIWAKEVLIGDPTDLLNSNVFLLSASNNTLKIGNVTSNLPPQNFSQFNNLYITPVKVGVGTSNPEKSMTIIGDEEINPYITRTIQWDHAPLRIDIDDFKGQRRNYKASTWGDMSAIGYPTYYSSEGYFDGSFVQCTYGSNAFTLCNPINISVYRNDGLTILAMVRFNRIPQSNETIISFSNNGHYMSLGRYGLTSQLQFVTDANSSTPLLSPTNILAQNEWALYTVRYDGVSSTINLFKNINYMNSNLTTVHIPIASVTSPAPLDDYSFNPVTNVFIGNANVDMSHLYIFDRFVGEDELLDLQRTIVYNANASLLIQTKLQPYPPNEFYTDPTGWLVDGTRNGGQVYKKTYDHMLHGNGTYRVWASSENPSFPVTSALNVVSVGEWRTLETTYTQSFDAVQVPFMAVELPLQIALQCYTLTASATTPQQTPSSWIVKGSVDGATWYNVDRRTNEMNWTTNETRIYYTNCITPVKYIKIEIYRNASSGASSISIQTLQIYGNETSIQVDGAGLGVNTTWLKERLTVEGNASISQSNIVGKHVDALKNNIRKFPVYSLGSNNTIVNGDTYVVTTSSSNTNEPGYQAFDANSASAWSSASNTYNGGGYVGTITTTMGGNARPGEWLQIQIPQAAKLNSYSITPKSVASAPFWFYVAGSVDGTTWDQLDFQMITWSTPITACNFNISPLLNSQAYTYYRLVVNKIGPTSTISTTASIVEWGLFGDVIVRPQGNVGMNIVQGQSYVSDAIQVGTCALYDTLPMIKLDPRDLSSLFINGANIDAWHKVSQPMTLYQPVYYTSGGHKNTPFARFNNTWFSGGNGQLPLVTNNGMTIVALVSFTGIANQDESIINIRNASSSNIATFGRYATTQQMSFTLYNSNASASNTLQSGTNTFQTSQWNVWAARYVQSNNKLELYQNNSLVASSTDTTTLSDSMYTTMTIASSNTNIDVGGLYIWDTPLSSTHLSQVTDMLMQGYPANYIQGSTRISRATEGGLLVKSATTYTNMINRYPPSNLGSAVTTLQNQVYGNGTYITSSSGYYLSNDIYNAYNAFQPTAVTTQGWYGASNAFNTSTYIYQGQASTVLKGSNTLIGEWIQIEMPDSILASYYTLKPRTSDYATTAPNIWTLAGSPNGIDWVTLDTQTYTFASSTEITFDISTNTTPCKSYRLVVTKIEGGTGTLGIQTMTVYGKTRDTFACQDDKVIVYDKLGVGLSNPSASLHVAGFSVLSGLKIIPGNYSNVVVPVNPGVGSGSTMWSSNANGLYVMSNVGIKTLPSSTNAFTVSGNASIGGYLGINQTSPTCPLHVSGGNSSFTNTGNIVYFTSNSSTTLTTATGSSYGANWSIRADDFIGASGFMAVSDIRIKQHVQTLSVDFAKFMDLRPVTYQFKDAAKGQGFHQGLIAQEVQSLLPDAVYTSTNYIPDIYKQAPCSNNIIYLQTDLQINEKIRLITKDGQTMECLVTNSSIDNFVVNNDSNLNGDVFVYGRYVTDHLNIDYQHLLVYTMVHVQELYRIIQRQESTIQQMKQYISFVS